MLSTSSRTGFLVLYFGATACASSTFYSIALCSLLSTPSCSAFIPSMSWNRLSTLTAEVDGDSVDFHRAMQELQLSEEQQSSVLNQLENSGLVEASSFSTLMAITTGISIESVAPLLIKDFGIPVIAAHLIRAILSNLRSEQSLHLRKEGHLKNDVNASQQELEKPQYRDYRSVIVSESSQRRRMNANHDYGLPDNFSDLYPSLGQELEDFYIFMTRPSTEAQESPIREATARIYLRHARLFVGWYLKEKKIGQDQDGSNLSLFRIFPDPGKGTADIVFEFINWLRTERRVAYSYQAIMLRGLVKLAKFRFAAESEADSAFEKPFADIPVIQQMRKLQRDVSKLQRVASRVSDEEKKWLSWPEYLTVVDYCGDRFLSLKRALEEENLGSRDKLAPARRKAAQAFQAFLILAFFANVPDRQRTIRELELKKSFIKEDGCWCIKHTADDYKTGKSYGDRPLLKLPPTMTTHIDQFLTEWRPFLSPLTDRVFVQPRTGKPLTAGSLYKIVVGSCYRATGKRTNPHLLRDMIVTHARESDASEKELEALALLMGHSIAIQRSSYDRRTLSKKVEPAFDLLQSLNKNA